MFIHGQEDTLIPFTHSLQLKEVLECPFEIFLPEEMNHNKFDYELDLVLPLKDFLKRNTQYRGIETSLITIPKFLYEIPSIIKEQLYKEKKEKNQSIISCFGEQ